VEGSGLSSFKNVSPLISHAVPNARSEVVSKKKTPELSKQMIYLEKEF